MAVDKALARNGGWCVVDLTASGVATAVIDAEVSVANPEVVPSPVTQVGPTLVSTRGGVSRSEGARGGAFSGWTSASVR